MFKQLNKNTLICGLIIAIAVVFFYQDYQINKWKSRLDSVVPDTVEVTLTLTDTVIVETADSSDIFTEIINDTVFVYKILFDVVKQPLFTLKTTVNSKTEAFKYDFDYNLLKIQLIFRDKYDLREGFTATTVPDVGNVVVDWGNYTPTKKEKKFKFSAGIGYAKGTGPVLLGGLHWRKNEVGMFAKEDTYGFYFKRVFVSLF